MASEPTTGVVRATAPARVCDAGGWTDTWFAGSGLVCNLAVEPAVTVEAETGAGDEVVSLDVPAFADAYSFPRDSPPGRHPLLETTITRLAPRRVGVSVRVNSAVPPASGLGTSASLVVATVAALAALADRRLDPAEVVDTAHRIETVDVGLEGGIQDQCAAAYGGASLISIGPYPQTQVRSLVLPPGTWEALAHRLVTVYLGAPHRSSDLHRRVVDSLGPDRDRRLAPLRAAARDAAAALVVGDLDAYGASLAANTEAQAALHPDVVGRRARSVIDLARGHGASGWKVNGAGGEGGSVTIVGPADPGPLIAAVRARAELDVLNLVPARHGVRVEAD